MTAVVVAFNQEKALVGAFSVIMKTDCETDGSFYSTTEDALIVSRCRQQPHLGGILSIRTQSVV